MPPERFDAVIIGASLEGLACALKLQQSGRKVCVLDRKAALEQLGKPLPAEVSLSALASAGRVLSVATRPPAPELAFLNGQARIIWPDPDRTVRAFQATAPSDASRFYRYISQLVRVAALAGEPGNINRAILAQASGVSDADVALKELGSFWARSGHSILDEAFDDPLISGALAMMAAEAAPISLTMSGTAPALIPAALRFCGPSSPVVSIFGGRKALISGLAFALREAGGELRLGSEVSEIEVERDVTSGVALSGGAAIKSAMVIAAVAPKRLAQGLISTRRFGFAVSALSAAPRDAEAVADLHLSKVPEWPGLEARLITQSGTIRLGASPETVHHQSEAYTSRKPPEAVSVAMRFSALEPCQALLSCPMVPAEWTQGGWT
ncbi:MAG TPA: hypothetical protein DCL54_08610, partial [Alphaproteobacteria bacterium]|nr:hypothetical protein [Alphaproteobacteria bacterium]